MTENLRDRFQLACDLCARYIDPSEMTEWTDGGTTAMCPQCGIDSVIPADGVSPTILKVMNDRWFGTPSLVEETSDPTGPA